MVDVDSGASMAGYGKNHGVFVFSSPARFRVSAASMCAFYKLIFLKKLQVYIFECKVGI